LHVPRTKTVCSLPCEGIHGSISSSTRDGILPSKRVFSFDCKLSLFFSLYKTTFLYLLTPSFIIYYIDFLNYVYNVEDAPIANFRLPIGKNTLGKLCEQAGEICNLAGRQTIRGLRCKGISDLAKVDSSIGNEKDKIAASRHRSFDTHIRYQRSSRLNDTRDERFKAFGAVSVPDAQEEEKRCTKRSGICFLRI